MPEKISIKGARVHNLKNVSLDIPKGKLVVMTGLSGSGKSSIAFDTIYAEGQRRYMESLSSYARQFLELQDKPDVDEINGLSPTIAIDQRSSSQNPRSTVGTITEIYDFLRLLYARAGRPHCHICGEPVVAQTVEDIAKRIMKETAAGATVVLAPVVSDERGEHKHIFQELEKGGVAEVRIDGELKSTAAAKMERLSREKRHTIEAVVARLTTAPEISRAKIIASHGLEWGDGFIEILKLDTGETVKLSKDLMCPKDGISLPAVEPRLFSFNNPQGACAACTGLGTKLVFVPELVIPNPKLTVAQGAIKPWMRVAGNREGNMELIEEVGKRYGFSINKPISEFTKKAMDILLYGTDGEMYSVAGQELMFEGVIANLEARYRETDSDYVRKELEDYMQTLICPACNGRRLRPEALAVRFSDKAIADIVGMPIDEASALFLSIAKNGNGKKLDLSDDEIKISKPIAKEIVVRMQYLLDVGLGYLTLDRSAVTLSGGEAQRVRLSTQLGTSLSGVIYILDEPSIGLHPRDTDKLMGALTKLRDLGNSVIVVEHDAATMKNADWLIDVGPGSRGVRRRNRRRRHPGAGDEKSQVADRPISFREKDPCSAQVVSQRQWKVFDRSRRAGIQLEEYRRQDPARENGHGLRRFGFGKINAHPRHSREGAFGKIAPRPRTPREAQSHQRRREHRQGRGGGPVADRPHAALKPGHLYRRLHGHPRSFHRDPRGQGQGLRRRKILLQRQRRRALRSLLRAKATCRSRCSSCPTSTSSAKSATASATIAKRWRSTTRTRPLPTCWR